MWPSGVLNIWSNFYNGTCNTHRLHFTEPDYYVCSCKRKMCLDEGGSSCGNFHSKVLCDDANCTSGLGCGNRFIRTHGFDIITTNKGLGLATSSDLVKGAFVAEYVGELIFEETKKFRCCDYIMGLKTRTCDNQRVFIDAKLCGNESRFINHSCAPNCEWVEFQSSNGPRVGIFSNCDIAAGQEITVQYTDEQLSFTCLCGNTRCRTNGE